MKVRKLELRLLEALLFFLPFHFLIFAVVLKQVPVLKLWRDAIMLAVVGLELYRSRSIKKDAALIADLVFALLAAVYVVIAPAFMQAANIARVYLLPLLLFHAVKRIAPTREELQSMLKLVMVSATVCCLYGLLQAYVLGPEFLIKLGYATKNGMLSHTYYLSNYNGTNIGRAVQRVVGPFSAPNVFAFYLSCVLIVFLTAGKHLKVRPVIYYGFMFLVFGTIVLTFSRSCWLAVMVSVLLLNYRQLWQFIKNGWKPIAVLVALVAVVILCYADLRTALLHVIKSSFSGSDTSVGNHFATLEKGIATVKEHFWGLGLGKNGPRALNYGKSNLVESSYLLMMFEFGVLGGILYFFDYAYMAVKAVRGYRINRDAASLALCMIGFALIAYFNIPFVQEMECAGIMLITLAFLYPMLSGETAGPDGEEKELPMDIREFIRTCLGAAKRIPLLLSQLSIRSKNIYIFGAWFGQRYSDNSRAVFRYALEHTDKKCFWICKDKALYEKMKAEGLPVLRTYSLKGIYYQLRAGVAFSSTGIVDFCRELMGGCIHVELWHGVGGGKKIGYDDKFYCMEALTPRCRFYTWLEKRPFRKRYFVGTSAEMKKVFQSAFRIPEDHFIHAGQARNDMFYDPDYRSETICREEFGGRKIILYMPTHRIKGATKLDMSKLMDLDALNRFCEENNAVFLIKKHFYHADEREALENYPNIIDVTNRPVDSNELLLASDYLISDYSSCTADYLLLDRPIFYYCFDYEEYLQVDRDMYWEFEDITPGDRCQTFAQLLDSMRRTIQDRNDPFAAERKRVRDLFYDPSNQCIAADKVLAQVENLL